ncbi:MAG TPA: tetratricopeptide repeat protein [Longimicrobiales bacterium]|nr:tetratricopeptide repeat protein [Longimicrobiales bacterium]
MSDDKRRPGHVYDPENPIPDHLRPPEPKPFTYKVKDTDSAAAAFRIRALSYGGWLGILGMFVGMAVALETGGNILLHVLAGLVIGTLVATFIGLVVAGRAGVMASTVYMPSGRSTPPVRQYSLADSLITRERFDDAVTELKRAAAQYPADPEPRLRLARLYRDRLQNHDDAVHWFRQTLGVVRLDAGTEIAATRELIEVYTHRLNTPRRALSDLARLAERHPGPPAGDWARREMAEIRELLRAQDDA